MRRDNPFLGPVKGQSVQWHDDEIAVASGLLSLVNALREDREVTYGPEQARLDQEITLAIQRSAAEGGRPISLPLAR